MFSIGDVLNIKYPAWGLPIAVSPDGRLIAINLKGPHDEVMDNPYFTRHGVMGSLIGCKVILVDTIDGKTKQPFPDDCTSWAAQWSPDGSRLAAYVQHQGFACVGIFDVESGTSNILHDINVRPCFHTESPQWTPDGTGLVIKAFDPDSEHSGPSVRIYRYPSEDGERQVGAIHSHWEGNLDLLDIVSGKVTRLAENWPYATWKVAPSGDAVALLRLTNVDLITYQRYYDLIMIPLDGSGTRTVNRRIPMLHTGGNFSWSPDSSLLAYTTFQQGQRGRLIITTPDEPGKPAEIGGDSNLDFTEPLRCPYWSLDSSCIYCKIGNRIWSLPIDGSTPESVTPDFGEGIFFSWLLSPMDDRAVVSDELVHMFIYDKPGTGEHGIAHMEMESGRITKSVGFPKNLRTPNSAIERGVDTTGTACYLFMESCSKLPELWKTDVVTGKSRLLLEFNRRFDDLDLGQIKKLEWSSACGGTMKGTLLLPPGYNEGDRVPLIVDAYAGADLSPCLHTLGQASDPLNPYLFAACGYAVFYPNMQQIEWKNIRHEIGEQLQSAIDYVTSLGFVDADRIGIIGCSFGGYTLLCALTQTTAFKAAVSFAGLADPLSLYGAFDEGLSLGVAMCESRMALGGPPWEQLERYIEASPLLTPSKIDAPLLLICGDKDGPNGFTMHQSEASFVTLRRADKTVELQVYSGEGHFPSEWSRKNKQDLFDRTIQWFDTYL